MAPPTGLVSFPAATAVAKVSLAEKGAKCAEGREGGRARGPSTCALQCSGVRWARTTRIAVARASTHRYWKKKKPNAIALAEFWLAMRSA